MSKVIAYIAIALWSLAAVVACIGIVDVIKQLFKHDKQ